MGARGRAAVEGEFSLARMAERFVASYVADVRTNVWAKTALLNWQRGGSSLTVLLR